MEKHIPIARRILAAETAAARVEGALNADEDLSRLWRTEAALLEAAASVGLEGERISPAGMVMRLIRASALEEETRAAEMGRRMLAVAKRPGDILRAPVETIRRIEAAAAPVGSPRSGEDILEDAELELVVAASEDWLDMPILAGWRSAAAYAHRSRRQSPAAERLVFLAIEGAARGLGRRLPAQGDDAIDGQIDEVLRSAEASWVVAPALAMTRTGFRIWSPLTGLPDFMDAAGESLRYDLGQLSSLRRELAQLGMAASGARGGSRMADLVDYLQVQPVVNSAMVVESLGVTRKTALSLLDDLEKSGCLINFTSRRVSRFWSLPSLARRMAAISRAPAGDRSGTRRGNCTIPHDPARVSLETGRLRDDFDDENLERIMSEIDGAMRGLDELLGKARRRREEE